MLWLIYYEDILNFGDIFLVFFLLNLLCWIVDFLFFGIIFIFFNIIDKFLLSSFKELVRKYVYVKYNYNVEKKDGVILRMGNLNEGKKFENNL